MTVCLHICAFSQHNGLVPLLRPLVVALSLPALGSCHAVKHKAATIHTTHARTASSNFTTSPHRFPFPRPRLPPPGCTPTGSMLHHAPSMPYPPLRQTSFDHTSTTAAPKFDPPRHQLQLPDPRATAWKQPQQISPPDDMGAVAVSNYQLPPVITSAVKPPTPPHDVLQPPAQHAVTEMNQSSTQRGSVSPNLRVPSDVVTPHESLPQLAAEITCLFWFESSVTLHKILDAVSPLTQPLCPDALPTIGFRKWVTTILSTTQVAPNVIILALLFIWRLKSGNPRVKGRPGSEYRLLTVALMLGNKFLDDNTYTNKTWAEVTGISVQEVHVMEVEFLSNMRYNLFTTDEKWTEWKRLLGKFGSFCDRAAKSTLQMPRLQLGQQPGRSPPSSALPVPIVSSASSSSPMSYAAPAFSQVSSAPSFPTRAPAPAPAMPPLEPISLNQRKRSADYNGEPAPKRVAYGFGRGVYSNAPPLPTLQVPVNAPAERPAGAARLPPLPHLSIPTPQQTPPFSMPNWSELSLPPPGSRSMAMVYPQSQWQQSLVTPTSTAAPNYSSQTLTPTATDKFFSVSPHHASPGSSPVNYTSSNSRQLSPSYILSQRQSPYRPVRGVQTLLVPPPSSSLQSAIRNINYEHLQYQPLGKSNERRPGPLPYMDFPRYHNVPLVAAPMTYQH